MSHVFLILTPLKQILTSFFDTERYSHPYVSLCSLSRTCIGPNSQRQDVITRRCPQENIIDLDSAQLLMVHTGDLHLSIRCVACDFDRAATKFLTMTGIELHEESINCLVPCCDQTSFHQSGRCAKHFGHLVWGNRFDTKPHADLKKCQTIFDSSSRKQWTFPPSYNTILRRIDEIRQGTRPGSDLVVLDDEYSPVSDQLWEFAIIERVSGKTIINTVIEHQNGLDHNSGHPTNPFLQLCSQSKGKSVYAPSRGTAIGRMNATQIAEVLQRKGIGLNTIFLVYGRTNRDLSLLRRYLESEGHGSILPSDQNCYPVTGIIRSNIFESTPKDQQFHLRLEIVFPIMFPRHNLIGLNHQALVDYEQTRLVCMAMEELSKPLDKREGRWRPETIAEITQRSILDYLKPKNASEAGEDQGTSVIYLRN